MYSCSSKTSEDVRTLYVKGNLHIFGHGETDTDRTDCLTPVDAMRHKEITRTCTVNYILYIITCTCLGMWTVHVRVYIRVLFWGGGGGGGGGGGECLVPNF